MAITDPAGIVNALANNRTKLRVDKGSFSGMASGQFFSLWRASGLPAQAIIPTTTPIILTKATLGAMDFNNQTLPAKSYVMLANLASSVGSLATELGDRLAHMGGLNLNIITSQAITGFDLSTLGLVADRRGNANYSDIDWYLECYTDGGATASNATINVTYNDATTGNLAVVAVGGTLRAGRRLALNGLRPDFTKFIRGINSVILSAATTVVGSFGFTAVNRICEWDVPTAIKTEIRDWAQLGLAEVLNDACLELSGTAIQSLVGTFRGTIIIGHG